VTNAFDDDDDAAWIAQRITATKALIVIYETAITALAGGAQSYQLDTGQTRQYVTKAELGSLRLTLESLESRLAGLQARSGKGRFYGRPGW